MTTQIRHPHLNHKWIEIAGLTTPTSIVADHVGKISAVLAGGFKTDKMIRARKGELDGLAISASLDAKKCTNPSLKTQLYAVYKGAFEALGMKSDDIYKRETMKHLAQSLSLGADAKHTAGGGQVSEQVGTAWEWGIKHPTNSDTDFGLIFKGIDASLASAMADRVGAGGGRHANLK